MSPASKHLQFVRRILIKVLNNHKLAKISIKMHRKQDEYMRSNVECHPALNNVWGMIDGLKYPLINQWRTSSIMIDNE